MKTCCLAVLLLTLLLGVSSAAAPVKTNIVLIMADDVGYECFGCYGSRQYKTPNLDRLAQQGMRFTHAYSQPLCTPSRVKLMTGLSNARNYSAFSVLNRDQQTIGKYFQSAGYKTMIAGKWQLLGAEHYSKQFRQKGTWPAEAGFDRYCLWQVDRLGSRFDAPLMNINGENRQFVKEDYGPEVATRHILEFIETNRDAPFFVYYPMILVHSPFVPTPDSESATSKDKQKNFEDMVAYMDKMVGRIVDKIDELGLGERTLILFTGDNGTHTTITSQLNGRTIRGGKGRTTDAGTRVPLIARRPGAIAEGKTCEELIDFSDFLPTCLEAAGEKIPTSLDGLSFLPHLEGKTGRSREWIYCYYCPRPEKTPPVRFARDQRFKLYGDGRFYDVAADPDEKSQVKSDDPTAAAAKEKLEKALQSMPAMGEALLKFPT